MMTDPRARTVTSASRHAKNDVTLILSCGHRQRRKLRQTPESVICEECPIPEEWAARNLGRTTTLPDVARPVGERLRIARDQMVARHRTPRVFYLNMDDYAAFLATSPPTISMIFREEPRDVLGWEGLGVLPSQQKKGPSTLYSCAGTSASVPPR